MLIAAPPEFSGSYHRDAVRILLQPLPSPAIDSIDVLTKEQLLQRGQRHYSELLTRELPPSAEYMALFYAAVARTQQRLARQLLDLAALIAAKRSSPTTLVSLARAGIPIGILLKHALTQYFNRSVAHYAISMVRERGIDVAALHWIVTHGDYPANSIVFVDGWTGKGQIAHTLNTAITAFNAQYHTDINAQLFTLINLAGVGVAPSTTDELIPTCLLGATVSGLISRSLIDPADATALHRCVFYTEFAAHDVSRWLIDKLIDAMAECLTNGYIPTARTIDMTAAQQRTQQTLQQLTTRYGTSLQRLKVGIGESTRVLLRRLPERVIVRDPNSPDCAHLHYLSTQHGLHCTVDTALPYQSIAIIKGVTHV